MYNDIDPIKNCVKHSNRLAIEHNRETTENIFGNSFQQKQTYKKPDSCSVSFE